MRTFVPSTVTDPEIYQTVGQPSPITGASRPRATVPSPPLPSVLISEQRLAVSGQHPPLPQVEPRVEKAPTTPTLSGASNLSVNARDTRLDTAYHHLATLGLTSDATWREIMQRYREILNHLDSSKPASAIAAAEVTTKRRNLNTAYACLRLLASSKT